MSQVRKSWCSIGSKLKKKVNILKLVQIMKKQIRTKIKPWRSVEIVTCCDESYLMSHFKWVIAFLKFGISWLWRFGRGVRLPLAVNSKFHAWHPSHRIFGISKIRFSSKVFHIISPSEIWRASVDKNLLIFKILTSDECFYNQIRYVWPEATSKYWDRDWIWTSERRLLIG